jgi:hypothetical protein
MKIQASGQDAGAVARHAAIGIDRFFNSPSEAGLTSSPPRVAHALAPIGPHTPEPAGQTRTSGLPGVMAGASVPRFYRKWVVGRLVGTPRKSENSLMISIFKGSPLRSPTCMSTTSMASIDAPQLLSSLIAASCTRGSPAATMRPPFCAGAPSQVVTTPPAPVMIGIRAAMS